MTPGGPQRYPAIHQYTAADDLRAIDILFDAGWISSGGARRCLSLLDSLAIDRTMRVLDIGCGRGGAAFMLAKRFGVHVDGIDITPINVEKALEALAGSEFERLVRFYDGCIFDFVAERAYDLVMSIDVFLHIDDLDRLFRKIRALLRPGGTLAFEVYCQGLRSDDMARYVTNAGYTIVSPDSMVAKLERCGFTSVAVDDLSAELMAYSESELQAARANGLTQYQDSLARRLTRLGKQEQSLNRFRARA